MYYSFKKYTIQTIDEKRIINDTPFNSYVKINLLDEYDQQLTSFYRGIKTFDIILKEYKADQCINLDNCYIKDFDIIQIKTAIENKSERLEILALTAQNSIFESNTRINFSKIEIKNKKLSFKDSYILKGKLDFHNSLLATEVNDFSDIVFNSGEIDFSNTVWGTENNSFKNSYLKSGFKNFQYADFSSGEANFTNVDFGAGDVSFINANFKESKPTFKVSSFKEGKVDFHYAHFGKKNISFERVEFGDGDVDFSKVDLGEGKINFNRSKFTKGDLNFEGVDLKSGKLTFKRTKFANNFINFSESNFSNSTILFQSAYLGNSTFNFNRITAKHISFQSCHLNNYVDFRVSYVETLNLGGCVVRDILDFIPYDHPVKIDILQLEGLRLIGKIFLDWNKNNVFDLINKQTNSSNIQKADQFRLLKENFHNNGEYDAEDESYISFRRFESDSILENSQNKSLILKAASKFNYYFKDLLLDKAGLYATSPIRVLWSMLISYVFFSIILVISSILQIGNLTGSEGHSILATIGDSFYFSIITYLTVGYGDFCPLGIDRWIAGLEGFVGVFLMAYFTVAFVRKILR